MTFFFGLAFMHGRSVGATAVSCGCLVLAMALGGGVGFVVGDYKHNGAVGFLLGALLGPIGWVIVALLPPRRGAEIDRRDPALPAGEAPPPRRPILISILTFFYVIVPLACWGLLAIAAFNGSGNYKIGNDWVTRDEFLRRGVPFFAISGSLLWGTAYAFWTERAWGRHLASSLPVLAIVYEAISGGLSLSCGLVELVGMAAFMLWYFYEKPNVVSYYSRLEARGFEKTSGPEGDPAA